MPFITDYDYEQLSKEGVNTQDIVKFISELKKYFNTVWSSEYRIPESVTTLDEINESFLLDYPSSGGYHILDDSFTGLDIPINLLCDQSKSLLGYFYGIHLDDEDDKEEKEPTILPELPDEIWEIIWGIKHAFEMKDVKLELLKYLVPSDGCGGWCPRGHCKWCQETDRVWQPCICNWDGCHRNKCILYQHKNTIICRKKIELPWEYISDCENA